MKRHVHNLAGKESIPFEGIPAREALITVAIAKHPDYGFQHTLDANIRRGFEDLIEHGIKYGSLCIGDWCVMHDESLTVGELAERRYHGMNYDTALPNGWVVAMRDRGFEPVGHFVTLYPTYGVAYCAPITDEGVRMAAIVASASA